jgi:hypothetical protein
VILEVSKKTPRWVHLTLCVGKHSNITDPAKLPTYYYIVMEYIDGQTLVRDIWNSLDTSSRAIISTKIGQMLETLRTVPSPGYYGRVHHQPFSPFFGLVRTHFKDECGPYNTYKELVDAIYECCKIRFCLTDIGERDFSSNLLTKLTHMKDAFTCCAGQESRLTYVDLKLDNLMIKPITPNNENKATDYEVIFIDWQHLGWLPAWFQSTLLPMSESVQIDIGYKDTDILEWNVVKEISSFQYAESVWIPETLPESYDTW